MYMMGMRSDALWCTWVIHFLALWLPLSIILTVVSTGQLFQYSSPGYIFIYFMVFFIRYVFTTLLQPHKSVNTRLHSLIQPLSCQLFSIRSSQHDIIRYFHQHLFLQFPHGRDHRLLGVLHGVFHIHWSAERPGSSLTHLPTNLHLTSSTFFRLLISRIHIPSPHEVRLWQPCCIPQLHSRLAPWPSLSGRLPTLGFKSPRGMSRTRTR